LGWRARGQLKAGIFSLPIEPSDAALKAAALR
jgi:hypothetical protein